MDLKVVNSSPKKRSFILSIFRIPMSSHKLFSRLRAWALKVYLFEFFFTRFVTATKFNRSIGDEHF
jgi:hypothetical protein